MVMMFMVMMFMVMMFMVMMLVVMMSVVMMSVVACITNYHFQLDPLNIRSRSSLPFQRVPTEVEFLEFLLPCFKIESEVQ
jgi:hypothetical protein